MRKNLLLSFVFVLCAFVAFAQTKTISGTITDAATKEPLINASIMVKGSSPIIGTVTDVDGKFTLSGIPADAKNITISYTGYAPKDVPVNSASFSVALETAYIPGSEVVVTSSRVAESIKQAPVQIEKMTSREIKSAASGDFYQSIGNFKGIDIVTTSLGFKVINLRGFGDTRSLRTKQYIDGTDNESPGLNFPISNLAGINDLDLESVEIVSGAASALYGANAMQGVINMNSKSPYDHKGLSLQLKGGGTTVPGPYFDGQLRYANTFGKSNKFAFKFTAGYTQAQDWRANDPQYNTYGNITADVNINEALRKKQYEPYGPGTDITQEEHDDIVALNSWLDFNPAVSRNFDTTSKDGFIHIKAPGYKEKDLADYNARNAKFSAGLYYRFNENLELSGTYRFGYGTTVYQATARYQIKDFTFHQPMLQLKGKSFFVRAYASLENAGSSYNLGVTGNYLSRASIATGDIGYASVFTSTFFDVVDTLIGGFSNCPECFEGTGRLWVLDSARNVARRAAEATWFQPGSQLFKDSFNRYVGDTRSLYGTKFYDRSAMVHVEGQYSWDFVKWLDIITGASYRIYMPNSRGTILSDTVGSKLRIHEVGAYLQATKRLFNDKFKIIGSVRVDKNTNFKAQVSPRGSLVYTLKTPKAEQIFRFSVSSAFRTPTLQDLYLYLDLGRIFLIGNQTGYDNFYTRESVLQYYNTPGTAEEKSNMGILKPITIAPLTPERSLSFDFGYRAEIAKKVFLDVSGYYTRYKNFIGFQRVVRTKSGNATGTLEEQQQAEDNIIAEGDSIPDSENPYYKIYQLWVNSPQAVPAWGVAASLQYYVGKGITPYINYTYSDLDDSNLKNNGYAILSGFNTPKHKINVGISGHRVWKGLGFNANFKWVTSYEWQSPFADGTVPSFHTLDLQVSYEIEKAYSTVRIGGSNIYNNWHIEAVGSPKIGALYYVSWTFDFNNFGKKPGAATTK